MPSTVLNALHSVSHLISQSNFNETGTRNPIILMKNTGALDS